MVEEKQDNHKVCNCPVGDCLKKNGLIIGISVAISVIVSAMLGYIFCTTMNSGNSSMAEWIQQNPQVIIDSVNTYAEKQQNDRQRENEVRSKEGIKKNQKALFDSANDPIINKKGKVVIVEFFDYNCHYCQMVNGTMKQLVSKDKDVKIIHKHLPILSEESAVAARFAIAVYMSQPAKYLTFHNALFEERNKNNDNMKALATKLGLNVTAIENTLATKKNDIDKVLNSNQSLAMEIGVQGTPAFVIGDTLVPGAVDLGTLENLVKQQK